MIVEHVNLDIPEFIYRRMESTARAMRRSIEDVMVYSMKVGSPPTWEDAPAEFQADLAAMDRLEDDALWKIARSKKTIADFQRYDDLLARNQDDQLNATEKQELRNLRIEADRFMLRKAHAAALLNWRGHAVPKN